MDYQLSFKNIISPHLITISHQILSFFPWIIRSVSLDYQLSHISLSFQFHWIINRVPFFIILESLDYLIPYNFQFQFL